jgi:hypothetical protein
MVPELPPVDLVETAFRQALQASSAPATGLLAILLELHASNAAQWRLEDTVRDPTASDTDAANAKRGIDRLNLARHHLVEQIDTVINQVIGRPANGASNPTPVTESPGMAFDRLSVLVIRLHHTEMAARETAAGGVPYAQRLPALREQLAWLGTSLDRLLRDLRDHRSTFLPYRHLKLYGSETRPGPPSAAG